MNRMGKWMVMMGVLLSFACSTTRLAESWKAPNYEGGKLKRVLVVGMTSNAAAKGIFEDDLGKMLSEHGVQAVTGQQAIPSTEKPTREQLEQAVKSGAYDAVVVTRPAGMDEQVKYVPGDSPPFYDGFYDYYSGFAPMAYDPGYFTTTRTYKAITNIYSADSQKLIWSGTTESIDPTNRASATEAVATTVVKRLEKDGLIRG